MNAAHLQAVVFDFDGLLVDSETPIYEMSNRALGRMGHHLSIPQWAALIGLGHDDSHRAMCEQLGAEIDRAAFEAAYEAEDRTWHDHLQPLPGVLALLDALDAAAIPYGVASSSSSRWVDVHLRRLELFDRFAVVVTRDRVGDRTKPDPAAYRHATEVLGVDPAAAIAIEDSAPGIAAARGADLAVVSVPSHITRHTDLSAADHTVASLTDLSVDTLQRIQASRPTMA